MRELRYVHYLTAVFGEIYLLDDDVFMVGKENFGYLSTNATGAVTLVFLFYFSFL